MSSRALENPPSKGDVKEESLKKVTAQKSKGSINHICRSKSLGGWSDFKNPLSDSKQTPGVRIVWRRSSTTDFENLNKVLGIHTKYSKRARSPSPKFLPSDAVSHMFSENFNPLSFQKRFPAAPIDSTSKNVTELTDVLNNVGGRGKELRRETSFKEMAMPSVKSLKSLFEKIANSSESSKKNTFCKHSFTVVGQEWHHEDSKSKADRKENLKEMEDSVKITTSTNQQLAVSKRENPLTESNTSEMANEKEVINERKREQYYDHINMGHLLTVTNLKNIFETSQSVPNISKDYTTDKDQNVKSKTLSKSQSTNSINISPTKLEQQNYPDNEMKTNLTPESRKQNLRERTGSVLSLKNKWETILVLKFPNEKPAREDKKVNEKISKFNEPRKVTKVPETHKNKLHEMSQTQVVYKDSDQSKVVSNDVEKIKTTERYTDENKTLLTTVAPISSEVTNIKRGSSLRNSVKDIAQLYEQSTDFKEKSASAPSTPTIPQKVLLDYKEENFGESVIPSPITSNRMNRYPPSLSLEDLKKTIYFERESENNSNKNSKDKADKINTSYSKNEMSLASLERKGSVKYLRKIYEHSKIEQHEYKNDLAEKMPKTSPEIEDSKPDENKIIKKVIQEKNEYMKTKYEIVKSKSTEVKTELNEISVDIKTSESAIAHQNSTSKSTETNQNTSKIESVVKDFVESEGLSSTFLQIPKKECLTLSQSALTNPNNVPDIVHLIKATDTFPYSDIPPCNSRSSEYSTRSDITAHPDHSGTAINYSRSEKHLPGSSNLNLMMATDLEIKRSGSRELMPDEMKFFQNLAGTKDQQTEPTAYPERRQRSQTIESSSPSSTMSPEDLTTSKLRSSSRQFSRELHSDELRFFGVTVNGTSSITNSRSVSERSFRRTTMEKAVRSLSIEEDERKE